MCGCCPSALVPCRLDPNATAGSGSVAAPWAHHAPPTPGPSPCLCPPTPSSTSLYPQAELAEQAADMPGHRGSQPSERSHTGGMPPVTDGMPPVTDGMPPVADWVPPVADWVPPVTGWVPLPPCGPGSPHTSSTLHPHTGNGGRAGKRLPPPPGPARAPLQSQQRPPPLANGSNTVLRPLAPFPPSLLWVQAAQRVFFDPLVPGLTAAKLEQLLTGVQHVLRVSRGCSHVGCSHVGCSQVGCSRCQG